MDARPDLPGREEKKQLDERLVRIAEERDAPIGWCRI